MDEVAELNQRAQRLARPSRWTHARVDELVSVLEQLRARAGLWYSADLEVKRSLAWLVHQDAHQAMRVLPFLGDPDQGLLDLSYMGLESLPVALLDLPGVRTLNLTSNQLRALPDQISRLTQLHTLRLDNNPLSELPASLARLGLRTLHLSTWALADQDKPGDLPGVLGDLEHLEELRATQRNATSLPEGLLRLSPLRTLHLGHNRLTALPDTLERCTSLRHLQLEYNQLTTLPEGLGALTQLRALDVRHNALASLPASLGRCRALETLSLHENQLAALPQGLGQLENLRALHCNKNKLAALPQEMGGLTSLRYLHLRQNKLTDLPWSMHQLQSLEELHLASNPIKGLPDALLYLKLREASGLKGPGGRKRTIKQRVSFLRRLSSTKLDLEARRRVFHLFEGQSAPRSAWFEALHVSTFADEALKTILGWPGQASFAQNPLAPGSVVTLLGKTALKKSDLKARLKERGLGYAPRLNPRVTHVVVGKKPALELLPLLDQGDFTFVSDKALNKALETEADRFLLDKAVPSQARANVDNLRTLLGSLDEASVAMGLELLKSGGVPEALRGDLFGLARFAPWAGLGRKARDLLKLHGGDAAQAALKDRSGLIYNSLPSHERTTENLAAWRRRHPGLDLGQVALMALRHRRHGLPWLLAAYPPNHALRQAAFKIMRQGDTLDLGAAYAHDYHAFLHSPRHCQRAARTARPFPPELLDHSDLKALSLRGCMFEELPDELGLFSRLERLDLSWGILRALPGSLGDLPRLVALDISGQRFDQVPQVVLSMTGLTHLQVGLNHHGGGQRPLWLTQEQRGALPALRHLTEGDQHPALDLLTAQLV